MYLQMLTNGLSGNNLALANYLNTNAPQYVIRSFALQDGGLPAALEAASPARNSFTTFAAQNAYLASSQLVIDHSRRVHFEQTVAPALTADASETISQPATPSCKKKHNIWFTPFGESAHEKKQTQTPAFTTSVGGGLLGYDYTTDKGHIVGAGASYVYTHVDEEHDMGKAHINQGFGTVYTTLVAGKWYTDISIWGGYYSSANTRNIRFPGVDVKAEATINGWQTAAHAEAGYDKFYSWFGVEPFAMADWVGNWEDSFHEHGAGTFNMGQHDRFASLLRTEGGVRLHEMIKFESGSYVLFREKASYAYQKAFHTGHITAFLVGSPGSFTVTTLTGAQNLGVLEFAIGYYGVKGGHFEARYQGQYGSKFSSHQGMFEFGWNF
jgi:outer membrane autotransporter protein